MKNFVSMIFTKILLLAGVLLGTLGVAQAQSPFTVTPANAASWNASTKTLTVTGNAAKIANVNPAAVADARIEVDSLVTAITLAGVNFKSPDVASGENIALKYLSSAGTLTFTLEGKNDIKAGSTLGYSINAGMYSKNIASTQKSASFTFDGGGSLDVSSSVAASSYGIFLAYGTITIESGSINAIAGDATYYFSFGIGTSGGNIVINGGTVNAVGGKAPGTGGQSYGLASLQGTITINGGKGVAGIEPSVSTNHQAFNKQPTGAYAPTTWASKVSSWNGPLSNPFTVTPAGSASWNGLTNLLTVSGNATIANLYPTAEAEAFIEVVSPATTVTLKGVNYKSPNVSSGNAQAFTFKPTAGTLSLIVEGENHITAGKSTTSMSLGITTTYATGGGSGITISGPGTLNVAGGEGSQSSGILSPNGTMTIAGRTLNATGGKATIKSCGLESILGNIIIQDSAVVNATGGSGTAKNSAGIYTKETITMNKGTLVAIGGTASESSYGLSAKSIVINGGEGTSKTTETYAATKRAFSIQPIGTLAPTLWDVTEASWITPVENPFTVTPANSATWDGVKMILTLTGNATIANTDPATEASANIIVNAGVTDITLSGLNIQSPIADQGSNYALDFIGEPASTLTIKVEGKNNILAGGTTANDNLSSGIAASKGAHISFGGTGTLDVSADKNKNSHGIYTPLGTVTFGGATINATGGEATELSAGVVAGAVTAEDGVLNATGGKGTESYGVHVLAGDITINGGDGAVKTTETFADHKRAFSKQPIGAKAPSEWNAAQASWVTRAENPFIIAPAANAIWNGKTKILTVTGNARIANIDTNTVAEARIRVNKAATAITLGGVNYTSPEMTEGENIALSYLDTLRTLNITLEGINHIKAGKSPDNTSTGIQFACSDQFVTSSSLTIDGTGTLNLKSSDASSSIGIYTYRGNVTIKSGTVNITTGEGLQSNSIGIGSNMGHITIDGGHVNITAGKAANRSLGINTGIVANEGTITINGGDGVVKTTETYAAKKRAFGIQPIGPKAPSKWDTTEASWTSVVLAENAFTADPATAATWDGTTKTLTVKENATLRNIDPTKAADARIVVQANVTAITLDGLNVKPADKDTGDNYALLYIGTTGTLSVTLEGENHLTAGKTGADYSSNGIVMSEEGADESILDILGTGTLHVSGGEAGESAGIVANHSYITFTSGTVHASAAKSEGLSIGIQALELHVIDGTLTANSDSSGSSFGVMAISDVSVNGLTASLHAKGASAAETSAGIFTWLGSFTLTAGAVTAEGGEAAINSAGVVAQQVLLSGGTLTATAGKAASSFGISAEDTLAINGGSGTAKTSEALSESCRAFSIQPIGTLAPASWDAQEVSWGTTSIRPNSGAHAISIYPNPTAKVLYIQCDAEVRLVEIFDLGGRQVLQVGNSKQIDVSSLRKGSYIIRIQELDGGIVGRKFVKE